MQIDTVVKPIWWPLGISVIAATVWGMQMLIYDSIVDRTYTIVPVLVAYDPHEPLSEPLRGFLAERELRCAEWVKNDQPYALCELKRKAEE